MKKKIYIYIAVCLTASLFGITNCTDEELIKPDAPTEIKNFSLQEAQEFFRDEAQAHLAVSRSLNDKADKNLSPGDFVPAWETASAASKKALACYTVPIAPSYRFKAIAVEEKNGTFAAGKVNVYQKLVVVKNIRTQQKAQYILTLIPTKSFHGRTGSRAADRFINCGEKGGFTGLAVYACVYSNTIARVNRYESGKKVQGVFLLEASKKENSAEKYGLARSLVSAVSLRKAKPVQTRSEDDYTFDGGWLDEVEIFPDDPWDDPWDDVGADGMTNEEWMDYSRPDDGFFDPDPYEDYEMPEEEDYVGSSDTGGYEEDEKARLEEELKETLVEITPILQRLGINVANYKIRFNKDACISTARTLPDNTIEVCTRFFNYPQTTDRASIIWHEIYHINHNHNQPPTFSGESVTLPTPPTNVLNGIIDYLKWDTPGVSLNWINYTLEQELLEQNVKNMQWYLNEVETYQAEKNNGIEKSNYYNELIDFLIWKYGELANLKK